MRKRFFWVSDNIGLTAGTDDAAVVLGDSENPGGKQCLSIAEALSKADDIDDYGLMRIVSCLSSAAGCGDLSAADLAAWRNHEDRLEVSE